jgi:hypothetical protein
MSAIEAANMRTPLARSFAFLIRPVNVVTLTCRVAFSRDNPLEYLTRTPFKCINMLFFAGAIVIS